MPPSDVKCSSSQPLRLGIGESGVYYLVDSSNSRIPLDDYIKACCSGPSSQNDCFRLRFTAINEKIPKQVLPVQDMGLAVSIEDSFIPPDFSLYIDPTLLEKTPVVISEKPSTPLDIPDTSYYINTADIFTGAAAASALIISALQAASNAKKQAESAKCCSDSKISYNELNTKLSRLEADIKRKSETDNKALHAEMYEHYKELKDLKEDSENVKDLLGKLVDRMK